MNDMKATFLLTIDMGNDAMRTHAHVAHALREVAGRLDLGHTDGHVRDANGNTCGAFESTFRELVITSKEREDDQDDASYTYEDDGTRVMYDDSDLIDEITVDILGYVPEGEDKDLEAKARKYAKDHVASCRRYLTYEDAYRVEVSRREGMCDLVNFVEACDLDEAVENIDSSLTTSRVIDARRADVAQDLEEFVYLALDAIL